MQHKTILFIVTSHAKIPNTGKNTGLWLEELTTPYYAFKDAGYRVEIASITGGVVPIDPSSQKTIGQNPTSVDRFLQDKEVLAAIKNTPAISKIDAKNYAAVFLPGGHGTMWDLPGSEKLAAIVSSTLESGRVVAAVCHGPAGLVSAKDKKGQPVVKGRQVSAFTNAEEEAAGLTKTVPFLLESRLRELGALVKTGPNFQAFAIADGNLITGQNPASSEKVATLVIERLKSLDKKGA